MSSWNRYLPPEESPSVGGGESFDDPSSSPRSGGSNLALSGSNTPYGSSPSQSPKLQQPPLSSSPPPRGEDVMKLPRRDMKLFGQCPVQDDFVLVTCDICLRSVKIEAFEQHYRLRHDRDAAVSNRSRVKERTSVLASTRITPPPMRQCKVELIKEEFPHAFSSCSSSSFSSATTTPSHSRASSVTAFIQPPKPSSSPSAVSMKEDLLMDIDDDDDDPPKSLISHLTNNSSSRSSSTDNVISIPDTDPLPHSMSNDLMAMVSGNISCTYPNVKDELAMEVADSLRIEPTVIKLQATNGPSKFPLRVQQITSPSPSTVTLASSGKHVSSSPGKKSSLPGRSERKPLREYHPDHHCGVWDNEFHRHCTRALTCKSHSVLLKRKIEGRSKSFDELVLEHKQSKEVAAAAIVAQRQMGLMPAPPPPSMSSLLPSPSPLKVEDMLSSMSELSPIEQSSRYQQQPVRSKIRVGSSGWSPVSSLIGISGSPKLIGGFTSAQSKRVLLSREPDENLHYTLDHPKPIAVCTFGGRRFGGLLASDRSQIVTGKLIRISLASAGLRVKKHVNISAVRYHPLQQQQQNNSGPVQKHFQQPKFTSSARPIQPMESNHLVNYSLLPATLRPHPSVIGTAASLGMSGLSPVTVLPPGFTNGPVGGGGGGLSHLNIATPTETTFKTDIQDFKGGIKFELGRKIKHISP